MKSVDSRYNLIDSTSTNLASLKKQPFNAFGGDLVIKKLLVKLSSLVLINELGDPFSFSLAGLGESLGVGFIWQTEIRVMS